MIRVFIDDRLTPVQTPTSVADLLGSFQIKESRFRFFARHAYRICTYGDQTVLTGRVRGLTQVVAQADDSRAPLIVIRSRPWSWQVLEPGSKRVLGKVWIRHRLFRRARVEIRAAGGGVAGRFVDRSKGSLELRVGEHSAGTIGCTESLIGRKATFSCTVYDAALQLDQRLILAAFILGRDVARPKPARTPATSPAAALTT